MVLDYSSLQYQYEGTSGFLLGISVSHEALEKTGSLEVFAQ